MWFKRRKSAPAGDAGEAEALRAAAQRARNLDMLPVRNTLVREETLEGGLVRLTYLSAYKPWFAGIARRAGVWDGRPLERKLELDVLGSLCWGMIDGLNSVRDMAAGLAARYSLPAREAEISVAAFLRELGKRGIVGFQEPGAPGRKADRKTDGKKKGGAR